MFKTYLNKELFSSFLRQAERTEDVSKQQKHLSLSHPHPHPQHHPHPGVFTGGTQPWVVKSEIQVRAGGMRDADTNGLISTHLPVKPYCALAIHYMWEWYYLN